MCITITCQHNFRCIHPYIPDSWFNSISWRFFKLSKPYSRTFNILTCFKDVNGNGLKVFCHHFYHDIAFLAFSSISLFTYRHSIWRHFFLDLLFNVHCLFTSVNSVHFLETMTTTARTLQEEFDIAGSYPLLYGYNYSPWCSYPILYGYNYSPWCSYPILYGYNYGPWWMERAIFLCKIN